jgi:hypothetical protein
MVGSSRISIRLSSMFALLTLAPGCATTPSKPANAALRAGDVKFVEHYVEIEAESSKAMCNVRMQNVGREPIRNVSFRLTLRAKNNGKLVYSRVHTLALDLGPRDVASKQFYLQEFVYNIPYDYLFDEVEVW